MKTSELRKSTEKSGSGGAGVDEISDMIEEHYDDDFDIEQS